MTISIKTLKGGEPLDLTFEMLTLVLGSPADDGATLIYGVMGLFRKVGISKDLDMTSPHGDIHRGQVSDALQRSRLKLTYYGSARGEEPIRPADNFLAKLRGPNPTHVALCNPEAGLHPARCLDLADALVDLAKGNVYTMVSTYSAEILSRVARRVAEGSLDHRLVRVIILEDVPGAAPGYGEIRQVGFNEMGTLEGDMSPIFEERFSEVSAIQRAQRRREAGQASGAL